MRLESPCRGVCYLRGTLCVGCFRNIEEIASWGSLDVSERMEIMREIDSRAKCPECGVWNKCAVEEGWSPNLCWCMQEPTRLVSSEYPACLCRTCFKIEEE